MKRVELLCRRDGHLGQPTGRFALVDDGDFELVSAHKWNLMNGYAATKIAGVTVKMHRLILGLTDPDAWVDHVNRKRLDNQRGNLRVCDAAQNARNASTRTDNSSGVRGVSWHSRYGKWQAYITSDGRRKNLGYFDNKDDAISARQRAERREWPLDHIPD